MSSPLMSATGATFLSESDNHCADNRCADHNLAAAGGSTGS